jgi:hypothetical protein
MGNIMFKMLKGFMALVLPYGDLIVRATMEKGSLDKWWTLLITSPIPMPFSPFNIFGAIMHTFGFIKDGKATPFDFFMLIPIFVKLMVALAIWAYNKNEDGDETTIQLLISIIVPIIFTAIPLLIRAYKTCNEPAKPNILNVGPDMILCTVLATLGGMFIPCLIQYIPVYGEVWAQIPRIKEISSVIIWIWTYIVCYCLTIMVNNHKDTSYCSDTGVNTFLAGKSVIAFIQVMLLVGALFFKDQIYELLQCS